MNSKFNLIFYNVLLQTYDPQSTVITLCTEENIFDTIYNYYREYYKTHQNLRAQKYLRNNQTGQQILQKPSDPMDMLIQDEEHMRYVEGDFRSIGWSINKKIRYFICLDHGYLVGVLKYWIYANDTHGCPCIGYISVNNNFKNQKYGIALFDACFKYTKENYPDKVLFLTQFSDQGQLYAKHICKRLSEKYGIEIFVTDDIYRLWEQLTTGRKRELTFQPTQKILKILGYDKEFNLKF